MPRQSDTPLPTAGRSRPGLFKTVLDALVQSRMRAAERQAAAELGWRKSR